MRINSVNLSNPNCCGGKKQSPAFKSIFYHNSELEWVVYVPNKVANGAIKYMGMELGILPVVKTIEEMVINLGEKVKETKNFRKIKQLLKQAIDEVSPTIEKEKELIEDVNIRNMRTVLRKGKPRYGTGRFSIYLDENEVVWARVPVTRKYIGEKKLPQP